MQNRRSFIFLFSFFFISFWLGVSELSVWNGKFGKPTANVTFFFFFWGKLVNGLTSHIHHVYCMVNHQKHTKITPMAVRKSEGFLSSQCNRKK